MLAITRTIMFHSNHFAQLKRAHSYEATITALNSLQSNADYLRKLDPSTENRSGVSLAQLDGLSVIHVTGTKGKGTTCAFTESILRHHGLRTGFYSSPHLVHVNERIRIDGQPLAESKFTKYFWHLYENLQRQVEDGMPAYFQMLTMLAFEVFIKEKVDVAIIEVGIGGEFDTTNVLRNVSVVGISSLGYDHMQVLGETLDSIAWHKGGIMKKGCLAFTVAQPTEAMKVLVERSLEKECQLRVVEDVPNYIADSIKVPYKISKKNVSLAVALASAFLQLKGVREDAELTRKALQSCSWPGRFQILKLESLVCFLDGAHTDDSISNCTEWFMEGAKSPRKALIFNNTGPRNSEEHLKILQRCSFDKVFFVPNVSSSEKKHADFGSFSKDMLAKCQMHKDLWCKLRPSLETEVLALTSVSEALQHLRDDGDQYDVLVTGSLHLIGAALKLLDPRLELSQE